MLPIPPIYALFDQTQFWANVAAAAQSLAAMASAVAMWAQQRARRTPADDVMDMVRNPIRWSMRHPVVSIRRKLDRRRHAK